MAVPALVTAPHVPLAAGASTPAAGPPVSPDPGAAGPAWRARVRQRSVLGPLWRAAVFLTGLLCIAAGVLLAVLPGPLTIPPVLLGLYVWSTEFAWARRLFGVFRAKARQAWKHARQHPLGDGAFTVGGLVLAVAAMWTVAHFHLVAWAGALFSS